MTWQAFVVEYGCRVHSHELAQILSEPAEAIARIPGRRRRRPRLGFAELFSRWHGRPPREDEWPRPGWHAGSYQWQAPERVIVARLAGHQSAVAIARILTRRLRRVTGDPRATRTVHGVHKQAHRLGVTVNGAFFGGITIPIAARRAGVTPHLIHQEVSRGRLRHFRVGDRIVIPDRALVDWQATRLPAPPPGWVKLWSIRQAIGLHSEISSWYAKQGLVPRTLFCAGHRWWIPKSVAADLIRRYRAGRPMPWQGGRYTHWSTVRRAYDLWRRRRHRRCPECRKIWASLGRPPRTFAEFMPRYRVLDERTKRHLTTRDGLTATRAAALVGCERGTIRAAIRRGRLRARRQHGCWILPRGALLAWARRPRRRNYRLRAAIPLAAAARRAGISPGQFVRVAAGLPWRPGRRVPTVVLEAVRGRLSAPRQISFAAAARLLRRPVSWVRAAIKAGILRPLRVPGDRRQLALGRRAVLALAKRGHATLPSRRGRGRPVVWLALHEAVALAGVATTTVRRCAELGQLRMEPGTELGRGWRYGKVSVEREARRYWRRCRFKRARPPAWLLEKAA